MSSVARKRSGGSGSGVAEEEEANMVDKEGLEEKRVKGGSPQVSRRKLVNKKTQKLSLAAIEAPDGTGEKSACARL